ncbi:hypothetical protein [Sphingomonas sp. SAFR-052]|uniref:hypothetical protein n=1 Tax=Sphingomonas sp. SAFR-052 TaxID=3436867 RepID=UPI003F7EB375
MTFAEVEQAKLTGTGCTWLGGPDLSRRFATKEYRGVLKRRGQIVPLRPAPGAKEVFPYTYHQWVGGGMTIIVEDTGRIVGRGPENVETIATLRLIENGRSRSWAGRLNCGS